MIEAVIFDMDGLLVDTTPAWTSARAWMAREAGQTWGPEDDQAVMGVSTQEWADYQIERLGLSLTRDEVAAAIIDRMVQTYRDGIPWLPGAIEAVDMAASRYRVGLASGSPPELIEAVTSDDAVREATAEIGRQLGNVARRHPDQWLIFRRFFTPAPEMPGAPAPHAVTA